jgi:hypothetical protein
MRRSRLIIAALCIVVGLSLVGVPLWVGHATAPGQRVHSLARMALPGGELAIVVLPAGIGRDGEIAVWWAGKDAPRVETLVRMVGAPAQPTPMPEPQPGEVST